MTDETLYRGEVAEYFLNGDGTLAGLFLKEPERFDRPRYLAERDTWGITRSPKKFWRSIPSAKLYLLGPKIVNLNLNYEPLSAPTNVVKRYVDDFLRKGYEGATITVQPSTSESLFERTIGSIKKGFGAMASKREPVILQGILRGEHRERSCRISAIKVTLGGEPNVFEYTRPEIVDSDDFPDGDYEVEYHGHKILFRKQGGVYLARS
jgi:hypothetical protein